MGVRIADSANVLRQRDALAAAAPRLRPAPVRAEARTDSVLLGGQPGRAADPPVRAGFGEGTVSTGQAAIQTIRTNFSNARDVVPSLEEQQTRLRAQFAEGRAEAEAEAQARRARQDTIAAQQDKQAAQAREVVSVARESVAAPPPESARPEPFRPAPDARAQAFATATPTPQPTSLPEVARLDVLA